MSTPLRFFIFSAGYNCADAAVACLSSVAVQTCKSYVHVVVDDASTDDTWTRIQHVKSPSVIAHRNPANRKWLANAVEYLRPEDEDIVVLLDLDDWLAGPTALRTIRDIYQRERCWFTYGDYCRASALPRSAWMRRLRSAVGWPFRSAGHCRPLPRDVLERQAFRDIPFCTSHLLTFKGFLWNALQPGDLLGPDGCYPVMAWDTAITYPMLEMCAPGRIRFVDKVLHVYNDLNPLNDFRLDLALQQSTERWFRQKPKYPILQRDETV
jgi:glycosyltransferase involved in cell wall biosynthesis